MSVVVDANVVAGLVLPLPYSAAAAQRVGAWAQAGEELVAPALLEYEVGTVLRKAVVAGLMDTSLAIATMGRVLKLGIVLVPATPALHETALQWAERLNQSRASDGYYLAVAESIRAELWTADSRLARGAQQAGATWVRCVQEG